ncbi:hypothetical protein HELRODRAFT_172170 [Helobdella robusta]|uniref:C-type lectin domain-containing protein n=1 Tax=Helobdella robusta TaxID=6412 RepID=T1F540_HELRO|nr:hypothetical protein HELRODRAFT_172170 [Helobdella robusta]ESO04523.1 hypothetical protein HELRODRAFT_172170 [Helobdella robusta]
MGWDLVGIESGQCYSSVSTSTIPSPCVSAPHLNNTFVIWTAAFKYSQMAPFMWQPYSYSALKPVTFTYWRSGEPNIAPTDYYLGIIYGLNSYQLGWGDRFCYEEFCTLCEIDLDI